MIPYTSWIPTSADVLWQKNLINTIRQDGVWGVPVSASVFKVNNNCKTFSLIEGDPNNETNKRIAKVFKLLGYSETKAEPTTPKASES